MCMHAAAIRWDSKCYSTILSKGSFLYVQRAGGGRGHVSERKLCANFCFSEDAACMHAWLSPPPPEAWSTRKKCTPSQAVGAEIGTWADQVSIGKTFRT